MGWFGRLWRERRLKKMAKAGALFRYWNGRRWQYGDPFAIWRNLQNRPPADNITTLAAAVDEGREPETGHFLGIVCEAFGVKRFDPATQTGLTDWEIVNLVSMFGQYTADVKKNGNPGATLPESTDSNVSDSPADQAAAEIASSASI